MTRGLFAKFRPLPDDPPTQVDFEAGWPCQRLRLGYGLVMFFMFEVTYGRQLPTVMPIVMLAAGVMLLASAYQSIRTWKLQTKIAILAEALDHMGSRR